MFIGEYRHSIDEKGRLAIPYRIRKFLRSGAIVSRGIIDKCLMLYPKDEWEKLAVKLAELPLSDPQARAFTRLIFSGAAEVSFDRQGRILLPGFLREYAGIKSQAVISGIYNRVEIWDERAWKLYKRTAESKPQDIAKRLGELGV